ncbi:hypothetical protein D3C76_102060 [compost metagenome]
MKLLPGLLKKNYRLLKQKKVEGIVEPMEVELVLKSVSSLPNVACDPKEYCSIAL